MGSNFVYLSVILNTYSRKIVGWHLDKTMQAQGSLQALEMTLLFRSNPAQPLIHHSDRGVQYCSWKYVNRLRNENVTISMCESGDPNENAMAERVFRILKAGRRAEDFKLTGFFSFSSAQASIAKAIHAYNTFRPHASVGYLTPSQAQRLSGPLLLKWYPYKKVRFGNVQYSAHSQRTG
ncbi:transposase [Dyadobacter chenhuakuii]|uniref:transposase n=1 Tax=Dyadobacter chenhuakuii TaxID=2909339 RepID=UPI0035B5A237